MVRYQIASHLAQLLPYEVQVERPRGKPSKALLVPMLKSRFLNNGANTLDFETGELTFLVYANNDKELIEIGQCLLDTPLSFAGFSITKKSRLVFNTEGQSVGTITFDIAINKDIIDLED